jgi:hypothetical protein
MPNKDALEEKIDNVQQSINDLQEQVKELSATGKLSMVVHENWPGYSIDYHRGRWIPAIQAMHRLPSPTEIGEFSPTIEFGPLQNSKEAGDDSPR